MFVFGLFVSGIVFVIVSLVFAVFAVVAGSGSVVAIDVYVGLFITRNVKSTVNIVYEIVIL